MNVVLNPMKIGLSLHVDGNKFSLAFGDGKKTREKARREYKSGKRVERGKVSRFLNRLIYVAFNLSRLDLVKTQLEPASIRKPLNFLTLR